MKPFFSLIVRASVVLSMLSLISIASDGVVPPASAKWGRGRTKKHTVSPSKQQYNRGESLMNQGDLDGAIDAFKQATYFARNGYFPQAHFWLGICLKQKGEDKKAIVSLTKATEQSVDPLPDAWLAMAEIYILNKDWPAANMALSRARMAKAPREKVSYRLGLLCDARGQTRTAEGHYHVALGKKPWKWTRVWVKYAECKMKTKRWAEAVREFNAILNAENYLKNEPRDRIYADLGYCKKALGDHQGAIDAWFRALDHNRENEDVWLNLGMLFESEKHYSSAVKYYKQFLALLPDGSRDPRKQQVQDRITMIQHMLSPNETAPKQTAPSPYMRQQLDRSRQQQYQRSSQEHQIREQQMEDSLDSGF